MPVLLFAIALTAVDVAIYGLLFAAHGFLVNGFTVAGSMQVGGTQILFRLLYLQAFVQVVTLLLAFKYFHAPRYLVGLLCAVVPFLVVALVALDAQATSLWRFFVSNPLAWSLAEGLALLVSFTGAWFATAAIRPRP